MRTIDQKYLRILVPRFREEAVTTLGALQAAYGAGDAAEVARLADRLRGSARGVAALALSATLGEVRRAAEAGEPDVLAALVPALPDALDGVLRALEVELGPAVDGCAR